MLALEDLDLRRNRLTGFIPTELNLLVRLRRVQLDGNRITVRIAQPQDPQQSPRTKQQSVPIGVGLHGGALDVQTLHYIVERIGSVTDTGRRHVPLLTGADDDGEDAAAALTANSAELEELQRENEALRARVKELEALLAALKGATTTATTTTTSTPSPPVAIAEDLTTDEDALQLKLKEQQLIAVSLSWGLVLGC